QGGRRRRRAAGRRAADQGTGQAGAEEAAERHRQGRRHGAREVAVRGVLIALWIAAAALDAAAEPRAEALKQEGLEAARQKNWEPARQRFEASYALDPRPLTLYNLAAAQENTGKLLAARTSYRTFLDTSAAAGERDRFRAIARDKLANLELVIPTVRL